MAKSSDNKHLRDFGLRLDEVMKEKHCTAIELAKVLGLSRQAIDNYRSGISAPPISKLLKMSEWFGVTVDWLLCRENAVRTLDTNTAKVCQYTGLSENAVTLLHSADASTIDEIDDAFRYDRHILSTFIETNFVPESAFDGVFYRLRMAKKSYEEARYFLLQTIEKMDGMSFTELQKADQTIRNLIEQYEFKAYFVGKAFSDWEKSFENGADPEKCLDILLNKFNGFYIQAVQANITESLSEGVTNGEHPETGE